MTQNNNSVFAFERSSRQRFLGILMLTGGAGLVCVGMAGFALVLVIQASQLSLHLLSTMPTTMGVLLGMSGWVINRGARRVVASNQGLHIEDARGIQQHLWTDLGWAQLGSVGLANQKLLTIFDKTGKPIASLSQSLQDFDHLVDIVKSRLANQPDSIASQIRSGKARKSAVLVAGFAIFLLFAAVFIAWETYHEKRSLTLLANEAIAGDAKIDRLFVAPNGITKRVEYTVRNDAGSIGHRNAEIKHDYYQELLKTQAKTIPVNFIAAEPEISRLQHGEVIENEFVKTPLVGYLYATGGSVLSVFLMIVAVLQWNGWDINLDSKTGKSFIKRFGDDK